MDEQLTEADRQMLADLNRQSRAIRAKKALRWTLILGPGIPAVMIGVFTMGWLIGGFGSVALVVAWALAVEKMIPVRELV